MNCFLSQTLLSGTSSAGRTSSVIAGLLRDRHIFVLIPQQSIRQMMPISNPISATTMMAKEKNIRKLIVAKNKGWDNKHGYL